MRTRASHIAGALLLGSVLAGCTASSLTGPDLGISVAGSQDDPPASAVDVATEGVLQALAEANADAFEVPATTATADEADVTIVAASVTYGLDDPVDGDAPELDPDAEAAIDDSEELLASEGDAVDAVGIEVTSVELSVLGAASAPAVDGVSEVTLSILATRTMAGLPDWEEVTYYVASVDAAEGTVLDLEVHDLAWYEAHPADAAQDEAAIPASEIAGPEFTTAALSPTGKSNVVVYANRWWNGRNPAYSTITNDCTNFISQALFYGGWTEVGDTGGGSNRASNTVWWTHAGQFYDHSHSWSDAQVWREFAQGSSRVASIGTNLARSGDVIQYDIGNNGMNHTTVVTFYDTSSAQPLLTYHSNDTHNKPLSAFQASVAAEAGSQPYRLFAWRT